MFLLVERTDTVPEMRALVNSDHVVAVLPASGGVRTKLCLAIGETWEIELPFTQAVALFRGKTEIGAKTDLGA
jgi:hypothetical protein